MNVDTPISNKEIKMASSVAPLLLFLPASSLVLRMGAAGCNRRCLVYQEQPCGDDGCVCVPFHQHSGYCVERSSLSLPSVAEKIGTHPNLCTSDGECLSKGSGDFCARFPNPHVSHGWCIGSSVAPKGLLKMMITDNI